MRTLQDIYSATNEIYYFALYCLCASLESLTIEELVEDES